jgi:type IV secretion system protein VirB9
MTYRIERHAAAAALGTFFLWSPTLAAQSAEKTDTPSETLSVPAPSRTVSYAQKDVVKVRTKLRYTTLIVLPKNEQILDFTCGDKDFWIINGNQNFAYVKPAKAGAQTNLNLVTASGNIYSFVLAEVSEEAKGEPELKVFVELRDETMSAATREAPRFVVAETLDACKAQIEKTKGDLQQAKQAEEAAIQKGIARFVSNVRFPYHFEAGKKPFFVRAMYHDDRFTYIQARPEETPTVYEIRDGQPNLVSFDYRDGVYVASKILESGYLALGKERLRFTREE